MASIAVILDGVDQMCCGEHREVGDEVTILVQNYKGTLHEERHGEGVVTEPITGTAPPSDSGLRSCCGKVTTP